MIKKIDERTMVDEFLSQFEKHACFVREVPVFAKSVDLVKIDLTANTISAIEFKTTKWREAKLQVLRSAIAFDYLEICILTPATKQCRDIIIEECTEHVIGLYFLDSDSQSIEHAVMPIHRDGVWEIQRKQIINYIKGQLPNE